jgi:hypothetical protein
MAATIIIMIVMMIMGSEGSWPLKGPAFGEKADSLSISSGTSHSAFLCTNICFQDNPPYSHIRNSSQQPVSKIRKNRSTESVILIWEKGVAVRNMGCHPSCSSWIRLSCTSHTLFPFAVSKRKWQSRAFLSNSWGRQLSRQRPYSAHMLCYDHILSSICEDNFP